MIMRFPLLLGFNSFYQVFIIWLSDWSKRLCVLCNLFIQVIEIVIKNCFRQG